MMGVFHLAIYVDNQRDLMDRIMWPTDDDHCRLNTCFTQITAPETQSKGRTSERVLWKNRKGEKYATKL